VSAAASVLLVIRVGIVGSNYGRTVVLPAFRTDPRCEVVALAGSNAARAAELAHSASVSRGIGDWRTLVDDPLIDAIAIAVPPDLQPGIVLRALDRGKPVFVEKPLAADLADAKTMLDRARSAGVPAMIDFNFPELAIWQRARTILMEGEIGRLRHVVVNWNVENQATRLRLKSWKTRGDNGGGILGNFVSHCFYYLEWFCGPITGLTGRITPLPGTEDQDCSIALALSFGSGAGASLQMSCASFLGSGHRIEFYGEDGTVVLANPTVDYFRGFELKVGQRSDRALRPVEVAEAEIDASSDSRIAPVARLVHRFLDACMGGATSVPGLSEGYRVQQLIDAARRVHTTGRWIEIALPQERP
jgi:predicted dehydrogenase